MGESWGKQGEEELGLFFFNKQIRKKSYCGHVLFTAIKILSKTSANQLVKMKAT